MRRFILAGLLTALPFGAAAQTYQAINRLTVIPLGGSDFEVIEDNGEGPRGLWCAAAEFAEDRLGASTAARLYVKDARGPTKSGVGRTGVVFTIDEASLSVPARRSYSVSVDVAGLNLPVGHAIQFCRDYLIELNDL